MAIALLFGDRRMDLTISEEHSVLFGVLASPDPCGIALDNQKKRSPMVVENIKQILSSI
jgi:hypothetical protein